MAASPACPPYPPKLPLNLLIFMFRQACCWTKITSSPTFSVQFCCSCYLYANHKLMNNMTCIAAPGYCSLHKSAIMSGVLRHHVDDTISCFLLVTRNGTSSASSLGLADLDAFSDVPTTSTVIRYLSVSQGGAEIFLINLSL